jgi:hypothetical protein
MNNILLNRMVRAAQLDVRLYEEVESDRTATGQAGVVVLLAAVAAGVGAVGGTGMGWIAALLAGLISALLAWVLWAFLTYVIGTRLLATPQTNADFGQMLRTIGFSASPGLIRILGVIPFLRVVVFFVASIWMLVAMVIAVRQALDYESTLRAVGVVFIGWVVQGFCFLLLFRFTGGVAFLQP